MMKDFGIKKALEMGILLALVVLGFHLWTHGLGWTEAPLLYIVGILLLLAMLWPPIFTYPALGWEKLGLVLGRVSNVVLLSLVFYLILSPIAWLKRIVSSKKDSEESYWQSTDQTYQKEDLDQPF